MRREGNRLTLNFPSRPPEDVAGPHPALLSALGGAEPTEVLAARDYLVRYGSEEEVRALRPNMQGLAEVDRFAVIVTAPGEDCDFVSRFFAPAKGVPEDPVTGSAHCTLVPYWAGSSIRPNCRHGRSRREAANYSASCWKIAWRCLAKARCI